MSLNDKASAALKRELVRAFPERGADDAGHERLAEALSKPTHTPGPWHVHHEPSLNRFAVRAEPFGTKTILSVSYWERTLPWNREQAEANARLIAAAPELLEACKSAVFGANHIDCVRAMQEVLPQIRAAIARASGGAA